VGGSGPQVRGGGHAGLGVPVGVSSDGAALERVAAPRLRAARARETPVAADHRGHRRDHPGRGGEEDRLHE